MANGKALKAVAAIFHLLHEAFNRKRAKAI
jgi:hypothetical protein